jgi:hypothetical protein
MLCLQLFWIVDAMNWGSAIRKCGKLMLVSDQNQLYTGVRICNPRIVIIQGGEIK